MTHDQRLGPPPVEPLSDVSWSRVERGLWARMDAEAASPPAPRPPRRWWVVAAPLVATAAAAIVVGLHTRSAQPGEEAARVVAGSAPSAVSFAESHLELDAHTALAMSHEAGHPVVLLERGATWFTVSPRSGRPAFIVRAGDATVRVVGTRFRVARSDEQISVEVERGLVDVQFRGRVAAVGAQQRWSSESPAQTTTIVAEPAAVDPPAPSEQAAPESQDPAPAPSPARPVVKQPVKTAPQRDAKLEPSAHPESPGEASDLDRAEYDRLAKLEPRSPEAALAGYLALARRTSRWADPALFAAARLAVDLHDRRAQTLLGIYLQRFPSGANATDAKQLLARIKGDAP